MKKETAIKKKKAPTKKKVKAAAKQEQVIIEHTRSSLFRSVYIDGAHGGVGPHNLLHINFFTDRWPVPDQEVRKLSKEGVLEGPKNDYIEGRRLIKEQEVGIIVDADTARGIAFWIIERCNAADRQKAQHIEIIVAKPSEG